MNEEELYRKYQNKDRMTDEECEWLAYYESLKSRSDSDHEPGDDPLVGALVRNGEGIVIDLAHRANGMEGDHAEYSILKGLRAGEDLSSCDFFTTLEPCVDDVRGQEGASCSSLLCASAVKTIYIGTLDPNDKVYSRGLTQLFEAGKTLIPFEPEVRKAVKELFSQKKGSASLSQIIRVKRDVFPKFQEGALEAYLKDKYLFEHATHVGFDLDAEASALAAYLLDKDWVSFSAKHITVDEGVQIMFYDARHIKTTNRVVVLREGKEPGKRLDGSMPLVMREMEAFWSRMPSGSLAVVYKEAFVNAFTHGDYSPNSPLIYVTLDGLTLTVENDAAPSIPQPQLDKLPSFEAYPEPGNGTLVELARLCGYCERDKRGEKTFLEHKEKVKCSVEGRHVKMEIQAL